MSRTDSTFSGSALITSSLIMCPATFTSVTENSHFSGFKIAPASSNLIGVARNLSACSSCFARDKNVINYRKFTIKSLSKRELGSSFSCQNPELQSNSEKNLDYLICASKLPCLAKDRFLVGHFH